MKVCANCVFWSEHLKGTCRLTRQGVGRFASCRQWQDAVAGKEDKSQPAWKGLPN